jgi:CubicO group peptidase (beta-lactamase class C family)
MQGEVSNQLDWPETLTIKPPSNSAWPKTTGDVQVRYRCGWFRECDLVDYMARQRVCALFVMSRERPVLVRSSSDAKCQEYLQNDRHGVASITKSIVSVVFGLVALNPAYGAPLDLDTSVAKVLARSGLTYPKSGVSIRQLLQMSSGMRWSDSETETALRITANVDGSQVGPHRTLREAVQARLSTAEFSATPEFNYSGFDTQLLGLLIEDRLGKSGVWPRPTLDQAVESLIWRKTGAVKEADWKADFMFHPPAYCCFYSSAGDLAKFGNWVLQQYRSGVGRMADWLRRSIADRVKTGESCNFYGGSRSFEYGYQWWVPSGDREGFTGIGSGGQYLHLFPEQDVVVVQLGAKESNDTEHCEALLVHRMIADSFAQ